jgi:predicted DNA binding protein
LHLICLAYLSGFDCSQILSGVKENTISAIAESLGVSRQSFQQSLKRCAKIYGLAYECHTGHKSGVPYTESNHRQTYEPET